MNGNKVPGRPAVLALTLALTASGGCSAARAVADGLLDDAPSGVTRPSARSAEQGSQDGGVRTADPSAGMDGSPGEQTVTSAYLVSPALTWEALQLQRPHALTASPFDRGLLGWQTCRRIPQGMLWGVPGAPSTLSAQDLAEGGPARLGVGGRTVTLGTALSLDREVVADRALRSGALLVHRGPTCLESISLSLTFGGYRDDAAVHW